MAHENLTYEDLLQIVELIKSSEGFSEFRLKIGEIEIELRRRAGGGLAPAPSSAAMGAAHNVADATMSAHSGEAPVATHGASSASAAHGQPSASSTHQTPSADRSGTTDWPTDAIVVRAPMVGTFYRSPAPGAPPFVSVGQPVDTNTTVCIIEVMKLMNSIPAGASGVVTHVLVGDGEPVNASAPLVVLDPRGTR